MLLRDGGAGAADRGDGDRGRVLRVQVAADGDGLVGGQRRVGAEADRGRGRGQAPQRRRRRCHLRSVSESN